jgi:hypothetical protein
VISFGSVIQFTGPDFPHRNACLNQRILSTSAAICMDFPIIIMKHSSFFRLLALTSVLYAGILLPSSQAQALPDGCCLSLPPFDDNGADLFIRTTYGSPAGAGVAPEYSLFTMDVADPALIAPGRYAGWCFDPATVIFTGGTTGESFSGFLFSSCDPDLTFNRYLPDHTNVVQGAETWKRINYLINHRLEACHGLVPTMWEVQNAIFLLFGNTALPSPPYPSIRAAVVQCLIDKANANAADWVLGCGDNVAVIFIVEEEFEEHDPHHTQLVFLEVPCPCPGKASIGDRVWEDLNGNGIQDPGEPGVPEVTVRLLDCAGNVIATTSTDENGYYQFTDLTPGNYNIQVVAPGGYVFTKQDQGVNDAVDSDADPATGMMACTTLDAGENDMTWDAGLYRPATIGNLVWIDRNGNGIQDPHEVGVSFGVLVHLVDCEGNILASTISDENGHYLFSGLAPGDYNIQVVAPPYFLFTLQDQGANDAADSDAAANGVMACTSLTSGETDLTWDAGFVCRPIVVTVNDAISCPGASVTLTATHDAHGPSQVMWTWYDGTPRHEIGDSITVNPMTTTTYTVQVITAYGNCWEITTTTVSMDTTPPVITCPPNLNLAATASIPAPNPASVIASDASGTVIVTHVSDVISGVCPKVITRTYRAVDACGNEAFCTQIITQECPSPDYETYTIGGWGAPPKGNNIASVLAANFSKVYSKGLVVGNGYRMSFSGASAIQAYSPDGGTPAVLRRNHSNPTTTESGIFGTQVTALKLNVDFSNAGITKPGLANLKIAAGKPLAGQTVTQVLATAQKVLGGDTKSLPPGMSVSRLSDVVDALNNNFADGTSNDGWLVP